MRFCRLLFFALFLKVANSDVTSKTNYDQLNDDPLRQGMSMQDIKNKMIKICTLLKLQSPQVCDGVITINLPTILYIIDSKPNLTADTICGVLLESPFCPLNNNEFNWTVNIDDGPPKYIKPEESNETINILQITDIHYDPNYEPYGNAYCNEPTCCRKGQNDTNTSGKVAGYWGDYHYCDSPWHSVLDVLDHVIAEHQNISYVYFTGDVIDHGIWETSIEININHFCRWQLYQPRDPDGQLQWLADMLLQAEMDREYVHILAHLPPGNTDCQTTWKREYVKIVNRFAHIIRAQFNGHTHKDELQLIYGSDDNSKISNVAWNGGSVTTYQNVNPNYKFYTIDSKNYEVKDFENWIYNLTLANINSDQRPLWYKSYSFKEEYELSDLTYDSLQAWLFKLLNDEKLLNRYYRNYFKQAEPSLTKECDAKCMRVFICDVIVNLGDHKIKCDN
ncbi:Sphingomyelin phosphodiesterase [Acromyrmex echinatior]|uniref:Sphingomyelin phosphodiesterase n=1 Tax=Acromyrmex echinatior TaxID=103372 RepID=F4WLT7_ACREC|nr:Sphingomyelin phosphodiesterase [Acromyrmex echinatior]